MILKVKDDSVYHTPIRNSVSDRDFIAMYDRLREHSALPPPPPPVVLVKDEYKITRYG